MNRQFARGELVDRLLNELRDAKPVKGISRELVEGFAHVILRRVDNKYLYRHRLTTLGAQLVDSAKWALGQIPSQEISVRAFEPTDKKNGYSLEGQIIETLMPDQPFIFDTLKLLLGRHNITVHNSLSVIFPAKMSESKVCEILMKPDDETDNVSYTRWYVDWPADLKASKVIDVVTQSLETSRAMVRDFHRMVRAVRDVAVDFDYLSKLGTATSDHTREVRDLLEWLVNENFVFMGVSFYSRAEDGVISVNPEKGLGSVSGSKEPSGPSTEHIIEFLGSEDKLVAPLARVQKSVQESMVHRAGKVDEVILRTFDDQGRPNGGIAIHGLFTFKGLGVAGGEIPILRRKVKRIVGQYESIVGSYEHKSLLNAFNGLPVEFLFEAPDDVIMELLGLSLKAGSTGEFQSQIVINPDASSSFVFVVMPKEHYSDEIRARIQAILSRHLNATYADHRIYLGKFGTVAVHFYLTTDGTFAEADLAYLEKELAALGTPWIARLRQALSAGLGDRLSAENFDRYREAFSESYSDIVHPEDAVTDILRMNAVLQDGRIRFELLPSRSNPSQALLRIYSHEEVLLTKILPVVDNFGVVVAEQYAFDVHPKGQPKIAVNTLRIERGEEDVLEHAAQLIGGLEAVFLNRMRSDRLNRILLASRLTWKEVDVIRAYYVYSRQIRCQFQLEGVRKMFVAHSTFLSDLLEGFRIRFDPDLADKNRAKLFDAKVAELEDYLNNVKTSEEDRVLRTFLSFVQATVRTNFYRDRSDNEHFLSFKIDSGQIEEMPTPRPFFEIMVHHAKLEGIHLRGGRVARGGLRWSDRIDDFRSEVLGLMATQMLKNTLIVPVGAKGGFVLTDPIEDPSVARQEADRLYRIFIRALLEVTDNIVDGDITPPPRVVRHDPDDPYLVVAADKGTAHLSDTANAVAKDFNFWLGDAFASGGSIGYDHKEKGITARGAWVCTQRHFLEMGIDPEQDPITVIGIGDMSGDVFGNGMLLSASMKLLAAFNHRHIFIDPNPDPAASFKERTRLFNKGRSHWTDYNEKVLSKGGGIYDRNARKISLSPEAVKSLQLDRAELSGEELIREILCAEVDLLWNGGIGTYVKASTESDADVSDKDNDAVRVTAPELRCKVIGEGGNLGVTMRGRVEYALAGGRVNLDAIDNSGGVDLSDHEVNLKTLLQPLVQSKALANPDRNKLLVKVGDEVCDLVLTNSRVQALGLSLDQVRSRRSIWAFARAVVFLREKTGFSRRIERLPRGITVLEQRQARDLGLMRPELAKLVAFAKMYAYGALLETPAGTREELLPFLEEYFPKDVVKAHGDTLETHMLFDEIAATVQVNHIVGLSGVTFFPALVGETERQVHELTAVYLIVDRLLRLSELLERIHALDGTITTEAQYAALTQIEEAIREAVVTILSERHTPASLGWMSDLERCLPLVKAMRKTPEKFLPASAISALEERREALTEQGFPEALAHDIASLHFGVQGFALGLFSARCSLDASTVGQNFFELGYRSGALPLRDKISEQLYRDDWDERAVANIRRALYLSVCELIQLHADEKLSDANYQSIDSLGEQIEDLLKEPVPVSASFVLNERLRQLIRVLRG